MKTIEVSKDLFLNQINNCEYCDDDCTCFGMDIDGRFYLYNQGDVEGYWLTIFDKPLYVLLRDDVFVSKIAVEIAEHNPSVMCDFCEFISDCRHDRLDWEKMPFELHDIIYAFY